MPNFDLKNLTDTQRQVWIMRYRYGWRLKKIALKLGTGCPNVCQILRRAQKQAGIPRMAYFGVIRTQGPRVRACSLSQVFASQEVGHWPDKPEPGSRYSD
jgi:hypothetical protein